MASFDYIDSVLGPGVWRMISTSLAAGVAAHVAIGYNNIEFERWLMPMIGCAAVAHCSSVIALSQYRQYGVTTIMENLTEVYAGLGIGFLASLTTYRLFLHRCRRFPGPRLASLSRFHASYLSSGRSGAQYYENLEELHRQYGDYVRTGPRELTIFDKDAIPLIYGSKTECIKSTWYTGTGWDPDQLNIGAIRDPTRYKQRRRVWDRGLSTRMFPIYEPRIKGKADVLIEQLRRLSGNAVDSTAWSMFYSFDVMGEVGFGRDFDNLSTGKEHPGIQVMHSVIGFLGVLAPVPWLLNVLGSIPGASRTLIDFETIFQKVLAQKEAAYDSEQEPSDVVSWILRATKDKDAPAVPTRRALTEDTRSVVIAGSDTTASTLANILFYLAEDTDCQRKVRRLLDGAMPEGYSSWDYAAVRKISYLDDIINETLRLKPAVITGVPRETPPQGLQIGKVWIPGHVNVVVPMLPIQRDPRWWEKPNEFIPERWSERSIEMGTRDAPWLPFSQGLHHCAGKDAALLTLRTAMAAIVQNFDITFAPQESEDSKRAFDRQFLSPVLMTPRPLHLIFTARDQEGQE